MDIEWEEPPAVALAKVRTPGRYVEFAFALRDHPGRWAKLPEIQGETRTEKGAATLAQNIRRGLTAGFKPKQTYEAVSAENSVWVRYVGESDADAAERLRPAEPEEERHGAEAPQPSPAEAAHRANPAEVRAWARTNGFNVPDRGRLSEELFHAYARALERGEAGLGLRAVRDH